MVDSSRRSIGKQLWLWCLWWWLLSSYDWPKEGTTTSWFWRIQSISDRHRLPAVMGFVFIPRHIRTILPPLRYQDVIITRQQPRSLFVVRGGKQQPSMRMWSSFNNHDVPFQSVFTTSWGNHLEHVPSLQNEYIAVRHGQSMANVAKIIASNPDIACYKYGLSEMGQMQAKQAGRDVVHHYQRSLLEHPSKKKRGILVITSDLLRAKQTADCIAEAIQEAGIPLYDNLVVTDVRLRERYFGEWDGGHDVHYEDVWKDDAIDPTHTIRGVESVVAVMDRVTRCIIDWDQRIQEYLVICVAHGDVLQILQTAFHKMDGSQHRLLEHLETATLRPLRLASTSTRE